MKKLLFLLICFSQIVFGQTQEQKQLLAESNEFTHLFETKNYSGIMDKTHPAVFKKVDRKTIQSAMEAMLNGNEEFSIEMNGPQNITDISEIFTSKNNGKFAFVTYPMSMKMKFLKMEFNEDTKKVMKDQMSRQFSQVKFLDDHTVQLDKLSMIIAVKDAETGNVWKYLNYDEDNVMYSDILPGDIMQKAKDYYKALLKRDNNAN